MQTGIRLNHLPKTGPPQPAAAMAITPTLACPESLGQKPFPQGPHRHVNLILLGQLLRRQGRTKTRVLLAIKRQRLLLDCLIDPPVGRPATQPMHHRAIAFLPQTNSNATNLPHTQLEQSARFHLRPLTFQNQRHHLQDIPFTLTHQYLVFLHPSATTPDIPNCRRADITICR